MKILKLTREQAWTIKLYLDDERVKLFDNLKENRIVKEDGSLNKSKKYLTKYQEFDVAQLRRIKLVLKKLDEILDDYD